MRFLYILFVVCSLAVVLSCFTPAEVPVYDFPPVVDVTTPPSALDKAADTAVKYQQLVTLIVYFLSLVFIILQTYRTGKSDATAEHIADVAAYKTKGRFRILTRFLNMLIRGKRK